MSVVLDFDDPRIQTLPETIKQAMMQVLTECLDEAVNYAKALAPVQTGALRTSVRREGLSFKAGDGGVVNPRTGREVDYAVFVELKYPFMKASWAMASADIEQRIRDRILEMLK